MIVLHYTGMPDNQDAIKLPLQPGQRGLRALCRAAGRLHRPAGRGSAARLARRHVVLGGRDRRQFVLDRHRDRQSRARPRLSRLSQTADRGGDGALPQHLHAPSDSAGPRARPFRCRAGAQAGSGREVSVEGCWPIPASASGSSLRRIEPGGADLRARRDQSDHRGDADDCWRNTATRSPPPAISTAPRATPSPPSSAISARRGSTASSTSRPWRR